MANFCWWRVRMLPGAAPRARLVVGLCVAARASHRGSTNHEVNEVMLQSEFLNCVSRPETHRSGSARPVGNEVQMYSLSIAVSERKLNFGDTHE
jgi:hypothetical protein